MLRASARRRSDDNDLPIAGLASDALEQIAEAVCANATGAVDLTRTTLRWRSRVCILRHSAAGPGGRFGFLRRRPTRTGGLF